MKVGVPWMFWVVKKWKNGRLKVTCSGAGAESQSPSQAECLSRGFKLFSCLLQLLENCVVKD